MRICKHRIKYSYIYCKKCKNYKYYVQCTMYSTIWTCTAGRRLCWKTIITKNMRITVHVKIVNGRNVYKWLLQYCSANLLTASAYSICELENCLFFAPRQSQHWMNPVWTTTAAIVHNNLRNLLYHGVQLGGCIA